MTTGPALIQKGECLRANPGRRPQEGARAATSTLPSRNPFAARRSHRQRCRPRSGDRQAHLRQSNGRALKGERPAEGGRERAAPGKELQLRRRLRRRAADPPPYGKRVRAPSHNPSIRDFPRLSDAVRPVRVAQRGPPRATAVRMGVNAGSHLVPEPQPAGLPASLLCFREAMPDVPQGQLEIALGFAKQEGVGHARELGVGLEPLDGASEYLPGLVEAGELLLVGRKIAHWVR